MDITKLTLKAHHNNMVNYHLLLIALKSLSAVISNVNPSYLLRPKTRKKKKIKEKREMVKY